MWTKSQCNLLADNSAKIIFEWWKEKSEFDFYRFDKADAKSIFSEIYAFRLFQKISFFSAHHSSMHTVYSYQVDLLCANLSYNDDDNEKALRVWCHWHVLLERDKENIRLSTTIYFLCPRQHIAVRQVKKAYLWRWKCFRFIKHIK